MTLQVYHDRILLQVIKPWIEEVKLRQRIPFRLEEDRDSGHGGAKNKNIIRQQKDKNLGVGGYFFNCASSLDLTPIENCWRPIKQTVHSQPQNDNDDIRKAMIEGWDKVDDEYRHGQINSIPYRLQ